jgi:hypothetical protein
MDGIPTGAAVILARLQEHGVIGPSAHAFFVQERYPAGSPHGGQFKPMADNPIPHAGRESSVMLKAAKDGPESRLPLADWLEDQGREAEARLLRHPGPVAIVNGRVLSLDYTASPHLDVQHDPHDLTPRSVVVHSNGLTLEAGSVNGPGFDLDDPQLVKQLWRLRQARLTGDPPDVPYQTVVVPDKVARSLRKSLAFTPVDGPVEYRDDSEVYTGGNRHRDESSRRVRSYGAAEILWNDSDDPSPGGSTHVIRELERRGFLWPSTWADVHDVGVYRFPHLSNGRAHYVQLLAPSRAAHEKVVREFPHMVISLPRDDNGNYLHFTSRKGVPGGFQVYKKGVPIGTAFRSREEMLWGTAKS